MSMPPTSDVPPPSKHVSGMTVVIAIVVVAVALAGWLYWSAPSPKRFSKIVESLQAGELKDHPTGKVSLVGSFAGITPRDEMFLLRRPDGSFLAMFPTYYNKGADIAGLLFTSRPLLPADTYENAHGTNIGKRRVDVAGARKLNIDRRLDEHWYEVSYGLE